MISRPLQLMVSDSGLAIMSFGVPLYTESRSKTFPTASCPWPVPDALMFV